MVLLLAEQLEVPFRERNQMLLAAGHAPVFPERALEDPEMAPVREALDVLLDGHEPYPAVVVDRHWNLVAANPAMAALAQWVDPALLEPPVNVMRLGLNPAGLAAGIVNLGEVRAYFVGRLERQVALSGDEFLAALLDEVAAYPAPAYEQDPATEAAAGNILTPMMRLQIPDAPELSFFFTVASFGTAVEVTASELSIELGFPADAATAEALKKLPRR
jgi:hypothetical protein